jgi:hypothetical protein
MAASLRGSVGTGTKEDESSTERVSAGFHHVTAPSRLAHVSKLMNRLYFNFPNFFRAAVNRGYGDPPVHIRKPSTFLNLKKINRRNRTQQE